MAISKVVYGNTTLIDISEDTVNAAAMLSGITAHKADGESITGSIEAKTTNDLTASGSVVTVPSGYYSSEATKAVSAGLATTPATTIETIPEITVDSSGLVTSIVNGSENITPTVVAGYISTGTTGVVAISGDSNLQLSTQAAKTVVPREYLQTAVASGKYTTGNVTIAAISSDYVGSNISQHKVSDITVDYWAYSSNELYGYATCNVNVPSGYYASGGKMGFTRQIAQINNIPQIASTTIIPTESSQAAVSKFTWTTGDITVAAIPSDYIGSAIASIDIVEGTTTVSGSTATRGVATWSAGIISSGQMNAATFANSSSAQTQYVDISNTTDAPVLVSGGYLYINKGYTDDLKISLAKLVPDGASADLASDKILSGYAAYNNDGTLIAGNIPSKSATDVSASGSTVSVPSGYYASAVNRNVAAGSVKVNNTDLVRTPGLTLDNTVGIITATIPYAQTDVGAALSTGYISTVASGSIGVTGSSSLQLSVVSGSTIMPTESTQVAVASGSYTLGDITIAAISSNYIGSNISQNSSSNIVISGPTVSIPSGYYSSDISTTVAIGSAVINHTDLSRTPNITINSTTGIVTASIPYRQTGVNASLTSGYITSITNGNIGVTGSNTLALPTIDTAVITPTESSQIAAASGKYTLGDITVAAISSDYVGSNIAQRSSGDLSASGSIVTAPSGYYAVDASASITTGSVIISSFSTTPTPTFSLDSATGIITATTPAISTRLGPSTFVAGYVNTVQNGLISINSAYSTYQLDTIAAATIIPTESSQVAAASGKYTTGIITVGAIDSDYVGSNIAQRSSNDLSASGSIVTVPSGYYSIEVTKAIASGSAWMSATTMAAVPVITLYPTGLIAAQVSSSTSITPKIISGYISSGSAGIITAQGLNTLQLTTQSATIYTPSSSTQTIPSGVYLTGVQTIEPIPIAVDSHRLILPEGLISV